MARYMAAPKTILWYVLAGLIMLDAVPVLAQQLWGAGLAQLQHHVQRKMLLPLQDSN